MKTPLRAVRRGVFDLHTRGRLVQACQRSLRAPGGRRSTASGRQDANAALRQTDYFGRYGGEEFALVLTGTMVEGAMITAERVRTCIEALRFSPV